MSVFSYALGLLYADLSLLHLTLFTIADHSWSWQYSTLLHSVMSTAFGAKPPVYATIVDLDRKIRDFHVPFHLRWTCPDSTNLSTVQRMQRYMVIACKETSRCF